MASSDDDELVLQSVTNYHFVDKDGVPISFCILPIILSDAEKAEVPSQLVTVRGTSDGGLHSVFKDVIAWKLILDGDGPEVSVLSKDNKWIVLEKPKKSYEECIRTTLFTLHLLHFSKKNPEASMKSFWEHLRRSLSFFDDRHCQDDFKDHIELIKIFLERDESLAKSQILLTFAKNPEKAFVEDFDDALEERPFIVDDELEDCIGIDDGNESEEETDLFDSVCAICDNGGELLCCEGRCMRSFHATKRAGEDSDCASLGLTRIQVEAMQNFLCKNCQLKQHQCFSCGKLGSSDKSANAEVFSCVSATCGHFYHPKCVAELLFPDSKAEATELEKRIAAGESFTCPVHRCIICKLVENKGVEELQFAICRRCPKAYHRKCLPRDISFEDIEEENIIQRAWDGLLPNRILIYCLKHDIDEELGTPYRDHITFPKLPEKKKEMAVQKMIPKKHGQVSDEIFQGRNFAKPAKRPEKLSKTDGSLLKGEKIGQKGLDSQQKSRTLKKDVKLAVEPKKFSKSGLTKIERPNLNSEKALMDKAKVPDAVVTVHGKLINSAPKIISEMRKDVIALVEEESSSLTHDDIRKSLSTPSCYVNSSGHIDKAITLGRIEGAIEAVRTALDKLEGGGKVEDAKAVCEPEILKQLIRWNTKLKVYLAPVLHGARYSSYGRHFTKLDKLHEITDKLQWYVQDGDMIVDFCCGANEFSLLMKEKLDAAGRKCSFKNYDILQAKNDFNFEMRDWMSVRPKELPNGSKLIMGLNPPFGLHSRLANQFVDKALTFRPKLIILIVPEETRRLDSKNPQYDLIWEDYQSLSGKSFYLPGSIDVYDKQIEQWNVKPPVLYLWSRPDWTAKHRSIASSQGHKSRMQPALIHKESQAKSEEDTLSNKNTKEKCMEKDATLGKRENMPIKQKGIAIPHDHTYLEPAFPEAQSKLERRDSPLNESQIKERQQGKITIAEHREDDRKQIQESHENREAAPVQKEPNSVVHDKKHHIEEVTGKKNTILPGEREIRSEVNKKNAEQNKNKNKKRKSSEMHKDKHIKMKKVKHQQQRQEPQPVGASVRPETDELPDMSMSPPDTREHKRHSTSKTPTSGAFETPFDNDEISHRGYTGSVEDMRSMSSIGRPSSFRDGMDNVPRGYNSAERDSFYMNTSHSRSGTTVYGGDYAIPKSDERYQGYSSTDVFSQKQYGKNEHGRPSDEDLRMLRNYGTQGEEITTGYGRSFNTDLRVQRRTYDMLGEEVTAVHGRSSSAEMRTHKKSYSMAGEEDHPQGNRFSLGGSGSASGNSSVYPSSSFRFSSSSADTSAMQRYAPHLDETNYSRMSPGIPLQGRDSYSRMSPGIPLQGRDKYSDMHGMRRDIPTDSLGYALGSPPFSNQGPYGPGWVHK